MCVNMGMFVNPDNLAFQAALNARIYVDKSGILNYTNSVLGSTDAFICNTRPITLGSDPMNMSECYAMYLNHKYSYRGHVFESRYKSCLVKKDGVS